MVNIFKFVNCFYTDIYFSLLSSIPLGPIHVNQWWLWSWIWLSFSKFKHVVKIKFTVSALYQEANWCKAEENKIWALSFTYSQFFSLKS